VLALADDIDRVLRRHGIVAGRPRGREDFMH
jgi:hypothetical protein